MLTASLFGLLVHSKVPSPRGVGDLVPCLARPRTDSRGKTGPQAVPRAAVAKVARRRPHFHAKGRNRPPPDGPEVIDVTCFTARRDRPRSCSRTAPHDGGGHAGVGMARASSAPQGPHRWHSARGYWTDAVAIAYLDGTRARARDVPKPALVLVWMPGHGAMNSPSALNATFVRREAFDRAFCWEGALDPPARLVSSAIFAIPRPAFVGAFRCREPVRTFQLDFYPPLAGG